MLSDRRSLRITLGVLIAAATWGGCCGPALTAPGSRQRSDTYDRSQFGPSWVDVDRNGCSTRDDVLRRDLTGVRLRGRCVVIAGVLEADPYTQRRIEFVKARASLVQIDHIVSLADAWRSGADRWTDQRRIAFANDPYNLIAVDGPTNASKADQGPDTWLPANKASACRYAKRYAEAKAKWSLTSTPNQAHAIQATLDACGNRGTP